MAWRARIQWMLAAALLALVAAGCASTPAESADAGDVAAPIESREATSDVSEVNSVDSVAPEDVAVTTEQPVVTAAPADDPVEDAPETGLTRVSAADVQAALAGNTIVGNWVGEDYRQFFADTGTTTYRPVVSGVDSIGQWRVNDDTGQYESLWNNRLPWDVYDVYRDGDDWFWTGGGVDMSPFTIVEGNQLSSGT